MDWRNFIRDAIQWLRGVLDSILEQKAVAYLCGFALAASLLLGVLIYLVDPNIHSAWDGVWYAWVTMTHVGFGDVVPTSLLGRTLASFIILLGIIIMALLFASLSAIFLAREVSVVEREESQILEELKKLQRRLDALEKRSKSKD